jgi:acyl carrier protein
MSQKKSFSNLHDEVLEAVRLISLNPQEKIGVDTDLFESGALDSVVLVGLLTKLEEKFQLEIPPNEFSPENFSTVAGITKLILRLKSK